MGLNRNFLPPLIGVAMSKAQFCFCTGCTPYNLKKVLNNNAEAFARLGYNKYDKILMPSVVLELLHRTRLQIDVDLYAQYVQRASRA